jgi:hypothetical protein
MNELQAIRRAYEEPVEVALATLIPPIRVYTDNRFYDADDANSEFCLCRLSFGLMTENTIGLCGDIEFIRGALVVEVFTPKGAGPGRAQSAAQAIWTNLMPLNRVLSKGEGVLARIGEIRGPSFTPLQGRPHFMTSISAPIRARWYGPGPLPPGVVRGVVTDENLEVIKDPVAAARAARAGEPAEWVTTST